LAWTLTNLADVAREKFHIEEADRLYAQALGLFRQLGDQPGLASCMADLGTIALLREKYMEGAQLYQEGLVIVGDLGDRRGIARVLEGFAAMASARGRHETALWLAAAIQSERNRLGLQRSRAQHARVDAIITTARAALCNRANEIWAEGDRTSLEGTIKYALKTAVL
jgi:hypothetical protein